MPMNQGWAKLQPSENDGDITNSDYNRVLLKRQTMPLGVNTMNQYHQDHTYMLD